MSETQEHRLARLTELAQRVWQGMALTVARSEIGEWQVRHEEAGSVYLEVFELHDGGDNEALHALEAALCVLAGEVPPWVQALAEEWLAEADRIPKYEKYDHSVKHVKAAVLVGERCYRTLAKELLEAAKGGARG